MSSEKAEVRREKAEGITAHDLAAMYSRALRGTRLGPLVMDTSRQPVGFVKKNGVTYQVQVVLQADVSEWVGEEEDA